MKNNLFSKIFLSTLAIFILAGPVIGAGQILYNPLVKGNFTIVGSTSQQGTLTSTNSAGTGAGTIQAIQGQSLTVQTVLPTTAGAAGGTLSITGAAGAAGATTTPGGAGSPVTLTTGAGGAKTGTGAAAGGAGGAYTVALGAGGNTASAGANAGGAAGTFTITGAAGGNATAGTGDGGKGSNINLNPGSGGTSAGGTAGNDGLVITGKSLLQNHSPLAINATATATVGQVLKGYVTSTSGAATGITLPSATTLATALGASQGSSYEFYVDNTSGSNTVTVIVGSGITAAAPVITGGATLTVAASATAGVGIFRLVFFSTTGAVLYRIG